MTTLVVVDGGSDRTDQVAKDSGALTFVLSENLGHGYALRVGYALCVELGAQFVVTLDADGQNDPAEIPVMLQPLVDDTSDFVVASRVLGRDTTSDRFRKVGVRVFSWAMSAMGHTKLTDTSNGYRALRVSMLDDVAYRLGPTAVPDGRAADHRHEAGLACQRAAHVWLPRASGTTKKGKNWLFGFRYGRVVSRPGGRSARSHTTAEPRPARLNSGRVFSPLRRRRPAVGARALRWRPRTAERDTRPPSVRAGGGMAGPMTTWIVRGLGMALPLGMARSDPPMPMGTMGAPVRAERKAAPSMRSSTTGPSRRVPSGNRTRSWPLAQHLLGSLERLAVGRLPVDGEGARR